MSTPAERFPKDVEREIAILTDARGRVKADIQEALQDRARRETKLRLAWEDFVEYHGRQAGLAALAASEEGHCPTAAEWFLALSTQVEELGI